MTAPSAMLAGCVRSIDSLATRRASRASGLPARMKSPATHWPIAPLLPSSIAARRMSPVCPDLLVRRMPCSIISHYARMIWKGREPSSKRCWTSSRAIDPPSRFQATGSKPMVHLIPGHAGAVDGNGESIDHVGFRLAGHDAMRRKLDALGINYSRMELPELGERRLFLRTPTGILLELVFREAKPTHQEKSDVQ